MSKKIVSLLFMALALLLSSIWSAVYLRVPQKWWYEDDPHQYYYVSMIANALDIFVQPEVLRGFGVGNALVPIQLLSYWIDVHLFGVNPVTAYLHNMVSFAIAVSLLFLVLRQWTKKGWLSAAITFLWVLLPSTIAVHYFIATRHYMEGLVFTLAMLMILQYPERGIVAYPIVRLFIVCVLGGLAMLCKEIYAPAIPILLLYYGLKKQRWGYVWAALFLSLGYAAYRIVFLGFDMSYTYPFVKKMEYLHFLAILPYMFTSSYAGYVFYGCLLVLTIWFLRTNSFSLKSPAVLFIGLVGVALFAIYPVTYALLQTYLTPGTWYRAVFLFNTILLLWSGYALSRIRHVKLSIVIVCICALLLMPGTEYTRQHWERAMARARAEGLFYLEYPDRLLYSEEEAYWFIVGVHELYGIPKRHYINKQFHTDSIARQAILDYDTIWRYEAGSFTSDPLLLEMIRQENKR